MDIGTGIAIAGVVTPLRGYFIKELYKRGGFITFIRYFSFINCTIHTRILMKKETLNALIGSINKWNKVHKGVIGEKGTVDCPLCSLYYDSDPCYKCKGCPILEKSGERICEGTPYSKFNFFCTATSQERWAITPEAKVAAKEMLMYLIDLLPDDINCGEDFIMKDYDEVAEEIESTIVDKCTQGGQRQPERSGCTQGGFISSKSVQKQPSRYGFKLGPFRPNVPVNNYEEIK